MRFIRIDGSTDPSKRSELVKDFQEQSDVRGAILSIKAAGVGLTLTVGGYRLFPALPTQTHRVTQAKCDHARGVQKCWLLLRARAHKQLRLLQP